jgi:hypothetical protein
MGWTDGEGRDTPAGNDRDAKIGDNLQEVPYSLISGLPSCDTRLKSFKTSLKHILKYDFNNASNFLILVISVFYTVTAVTPNCSLFEFYLTSQTSVQYSAFQ